MGSSAVSTQSEPFDRPPSSADIRAEGRSSRRTYHAATAYRGRWKGTEVITTLGSGLSARRSRGAVRLCRMRCHQ
jgi:hypothetical protein